MTGRSLQGAARYLYPSLTMRAGEEALGGEDGLPPRVPEGRSFGYRGADKDCSSRYRRLRPRSACHCPAVVYALLQP